MLFRNINERIMYTAYKYLYIIYENEDHILNKVSKIKSYLIGYNDLVIAKHTSAKN